MSKTNLTRVLARPRFARYTRPPIASNHRLFRLRNTHQGRYFHLNNMTGLLPQPSAMMECSRECLTEESILNLHYHVKTRASSVLALHAPLRNLQSPVPALGQTETRTLLDGRDWVHSGQLGHTRIFMRPPRPSRPDQPTKGKRETPAKKDAGSGTPAKEGGDSVRTPKRAGLGTGLGAALGAGAERWAGVAKRRLDNRLDGEDAWSCCGRTVAAAGRGCEPREPAATVRRCAGRADLSLDDG